MPLLPLMAKRRMVATAVLVATLLLSAANISTAYHDDFDASTVNRAVMSCNDYSNDRSDYMNNTCSDGAGGKELPPPGQGAGGCDHGTLRCQSWDYVTKYAGCASFIQQYEDGITGGKKYCQKECCKRGEFFPSPSPSPPQNCKPCKNTPSPYMDDIDLTCENAGKTTFWPGSRCNREVDFKGQPNPQVNYWRREKFCQQMCFEAGHGYDGDNCCVTPDNACPLDTLTCWDGTILNRDPTDNCNFPDCPKCNSYTKKCPKVDGSGYFFLYTDESKNCAFDPCPSCDPATKKCPKSDGSGYYTLTTSISDSCKFADCESCDSPHQKTCWDGRVIKKDRDTCRWESHCQSCDKQKSQCWDKSIAWADHNCQWVRQCPPCDKKSHICWDGSKSQVDPHTCTWIKKCPPPIACPYDTMHCWDGSTVGRNAHNCHFPSCPDRPHDIPGYNDIVQIEAVTKQDVDLCMNIDNDSFKEGTTVEFDGCDDDDISQKFYVRRIYHTDNTQFYIVPKANTNLYVTAVDVDVDASGTQGRLRLKKKGGGKQVFFLDYSDDPSNKHFKFGLGSVCYPNDSDCLYVTNNGDKAEDNGRIVVRTWDRIEANARTGVRDKTIFGTWKINTLVSGGNHHRNLRHGNDVTQEELM